MKLKSPATAAHSEPTPSLLISRPTPPQAPLISALPRWERPVWMPGPRKDKRKAQAKTVMAPVSEPRGKLGRFFAERAFGSDSARQTVKKRVQLSIDYHCRVGQAEPLEIQGEAGSLKGYFFPARDTVLARASNKVALILHGSGEAGESQTWEIVRHYRQHGHAALVVNLRGFGESEGIPSEAGFYQDAETIARHLIKDRHCRPRDIVVHGYSLGAPVAAHLATHLENSGESAAAYILDRPMASLSKAVRADLPVLGRPVGQLVKQRLGAMNVVDNLRGIDHPDHVKVVLIKNQDGLGRFGQAMHEKLQGLHFQVQQVTVDADHEDHKTTLGEQFHTIQNTLVETNAGLSPAPSMRTHRRTPSGDHNHLSGLGLGHRRSSSDGRNRLGKQPSPPAAASPQPPRDASDPLGIEALPAEPSYASPQRLSVDAAARGPKRHSHRQSYSDFSWLAQVIE